MGMLRFDGSGHFPFICNGHVGHSLFWASFLFIQTGMLRFGCSGHPFPFIQTGVFAFWLFWASFPFMKLGMLHLGISGHFSSHANGHVAYWLFWPCCPFIEVKQLVAA